MEVEVPLGGRVLVVADLLLSRRSTPSSDVVTAELAAALAAWDGPGFVVIAGNLLDLEADHTVTPARALAAHPRLVGALRAFTASPSRRAICLPGSHDGRIATDDRLRAELARDAGIEVATTIELVATTGEGPARVRVESEARLDRGRREEARRLVADGYRGLVSGHPHQPELADFGAGFYAAVGVASETTVERAGRLRMPAVSVRCREIDWVELEAGARLHVRLFHGVADIPGGVSLAKRLIARRTEESSRPRLVASWPAGTSWPPSTGPLVAMRRVRRRAATAIALAGALDVASAITPPLESRLRVLLRWVPLAVPQVATAGVALAGLGLLALSWGVRRGQRDAWRIALALLAGSVVLHLVKGADVEEAAAAAAVAAYLGIHRTAFRSPSQRAALAVGVRRLALLVVAVLAGAVAAIEMVTEAKGPRLPLGRAALAVAERLVGVSSVNLPDRLDDFAAPVLFAVGVGSVLLALWLAVRPTIARHVVGDAGTRSRALVRQWASGTLDYFALRDDKVPFVWQSTVVSYAIRHGVCLVSPDPVGPTWERSEAWAAFRRMTDEHRWTVAVLGAGEGWLETYRGAGMHDLYVGDEAVVDIDRFRLDGGRHKALRQAVNRVANHGYTVTFHDPSTADALIRDGVRAVMGSSRRGDVERGFSMTLGRIFDPTDEGLLLAVCHAPTGEPVAFCQYVPAPGLNGYSLDLMRRDCGEHPNGLLDFVIVETIGHLRDEGFERLGLNFATMRAVLAGETGTGLVGGVERWVLRRLSGSMQIESLWRFNDKFDPDWVPRYLVYDSPEHLVPVAFAVARAESMWEIPLIGRFLTPASDLSPAR